MLFVGDRLQKFLVGDTFILLSFLFLLLLNSRNYNMKYEYRPSASQLYASLKYRSKEYLLENNLHGISYFVDSSQSKWERAVWFILTISSFCTTIGIILMIWERFLKEPTLNELGTITEDINIDFPQVFLCLEWSQLNHSSLNKIERSVFEKLYYWKWGDSLENILHIKNEKNLYHVFQLLIPNCSSFFSHCTFSEEEESCSKSFVEVITPIGACCKFNASKTLTILDPTWTFSFVPSVYPFKLYIMDKMDIGPQRNDKPLYVIPEPTIVEMTVFITYTESGLRQLTQQQRQCHYKGKNWTVNNCELHCQSNKIFAACGCVPWFLAIFGQQECQFSKYSCMKTSYANTIDCNCFLPCGYTSYEYKKIVTNDDSSNTTDEKGTCKIIIDKRLNIFFRTKVRFGYLDLVVSFGGIAGVFLGFSIISGIEFVYYFTLKVYCGAVMETTRKKHNIVKIHVIEPKSYKLNVKSTYYDYVD